MFRSAGVAAFDKFLEKATSHLLLEVDLYSVIGICDLIRQKDCPPKYAVSAIKKKLSHQNPHVVSFALQVLESTVKNCGNPIHEEIASKEFMEYLHELAKTTTHDNVRDKILELIQAWAHAFRKLPTYRAVQDFVNIMKAEGCKFPPLSEADAMFCADTAPEWQDGGCCNRCRAEFGMMLRKHHCRACGQIFCAKCSSKQATLPKFGIEKEVRVCDSCFEKYSKPKSNKHEKLSALNNLDETQSLEEAIAASLADYNTKTPGKNLQHSQTQQPRGKTEEELQEEEQLQLALAISQSEAEAKEREKSKSSTIYSPQPPLNTTSTSDRDSEQGNYRVEKATAPKKSTLSGKSTVDQEDPELARYLDRNYWQLRLLNEDVSQQQTVMDLENPMSSSPFQPSAPAKESKNNVEHVEEIDGFVESLRGQIEIFVNRMRSNSSRGRHISNDTSVQTLFMNITALHSQLLTFIQAQEDWRGYYEGLQEKLNQVNDAREALVSLRKEHNDRQRQIAEEVERQRQIQLASKLHDMRQKKHQYLQYQRDIALRKVQDEEKQMQMRIDQQRMGTYGGYPIPGQGYMGPQSQMPPGMMMPPIQDPQQLHYMQQQQLYLQGQQQNLMHAQQQHQIPGQPPVPAYHTPNQYMGHPMQGPPPGVGNPMQMQQGQPASGHMQPTTAGQMHQGQPQSGHMQPTTAGQMHQGQPQSGHMQPTTAGQMHQGQPLQQQMTMPTQGQMVPQNQMPMQSQLQPQNQMPAPGQLQPSQGQMPLPVHRQQPSGQIQQSLPPNSQQQQFYQPSPSQAMGAPQEQTAQLAGAPYNTTGGTHDMNQPTQHPPPPLQNEPSTAELISFD